MLKNLLIASTALLILFNSCEIRKNGDENKINPTDENEAMLRPEGNPISEPVTISNDRIEAIFINNQAYGEEHLHGYNGVAELRHITQDSSIFVPLYAGFNLEHIFGGDSLVQLFEPRLHPMELFRKSENEVILYQSPTPLSKVESQTLFRLTDPHYIDVEFNFIIHDSSFFRHGYAGFFWASYIQTPPDKKMYFIGKTSNEDNFHWVEAYSPVHGSESTHLSILDKDSIYFEPGFNATLASHFSDYRFEKPYFFGHFHNMALIFMFDQAKGIRFSQSPTGGGPQSPAWDFQYILSDFKIKTKYSFHSRLVYKPFISRKDVSREYSLWNDQQE